jgi:hypothetical protein
MATVAKGAPKGAAQMDQKAKMKLILSSVVLAVAVVWIIVYLSGLGGKSTGPVTLSPEEKAVVEEQHNQELEKVKEESNKSYRGGKPPGPPGSS